MPQFFSSSPIDYGADIIARGGANTANLISGFGQQIAAPFNEASRMKQQAAIQEQMQKTELERRLMQEAAQLGVSPVTSPDGTFNVVATATAVQKAKDMHDRLQAINGYKDRNQAALEGEADELGVPKTPVPRTPPAAPFSATSIPSGFGMDAVTDAQAPSPAKPFEPEQPQLSLAQRVQQAKEAAKNAEYEKQRKIASEAATSTFVANRRAAQADNFSTAMGRYPGPGEIDEQGNLAPAAMKAMADAKRAAELTLTQRNARASVDTGMKAGYIKPEDADQAAAMFEASGGRAPQLPQSLREQVDGDVRRLSGIKPLEDKVAAYDPNGFGPVSFRVKTALGGIVGSKSGEAARGIEQQWKKVSSGEAFAQGGKQLTQTELSAIIAQVGKPTDADFPARLKQYHDTVARDAQIHLDMLLQSPHRFTAEGQAQIKRLENLINPPAAAQSTGQPGDLQIHSIKKL